MIKFWVAIIQNCMENGQWPPVIFSSATCAFFFFRITLPLLGFNWCRGFRLALPSTYAEWPASDTRTHWKAVPTSTTTTHVHMSRMWPSHAEVVNYCVIQWVYVSLVPSLYSPASFFSHIVPLILLHVCAKKKLGSRDWKRG